VASARACDRTTQSIAGASLYAWDPTLKELGFRVRIALFQPGIPGNVGACMRLGACFGVPLDVIGPCAFELSDRTLKRAALDYWPAGRGHRATTPGPRSPRRPTARTGRLVLFTTSAPCRWTLSRFSEATPCSSAARARAPRLTCTKRPTARVAIPIRPETRSLNLAVSAGVALWEALRQTGALSFTTDGS
jgi:tRNA (cytidine/uridine-2'-O-)-methyltransferase